MDKKFWISGIAASVLFFLFGFLVHGVLLHDDYMNLKHIFRPEDQAMGYLPYMVIAHILMGFAFAWIYRQGISASAAWLNQGIRFGVAAALLVIVPWYLIYYSIQPMPGMTVVKQILFDSIAMIITGIVVAFLNKTATGAETV